MARGNMRNLKRGAVEAMATVNRSPGHIKCGKSPRGRHNRVCLSARGPIPGMACGYNPVNKMWACATSSKAARARAAARR